MNWNPATPLPLHERATIRLRFRAGCCGAYREEILPVAINKSERSLSAGVQRALRSITVYIPGYIWLAASELERPGLLMPVNTAGLSLSTVVAAPEAASQEAMRVAPVAKGLPVTSRPASGDMIYKVTDRDPCPMLYNGVMLITDAISK